MGMQFMSRWACILVVMMSFMPFNAFAATNDSTHETINSFHWQLGPRTVSLAGKATISVPKGYAFLDQGETKKFEEFIKDIPVNGEYLVVPTNLKWNAYFRYEDTGYIKDNEKLDPDGLMRSIKRDTNNANELRRQKGYPTISVIGWKFEPEYDRNAKLLEWATLAKQDSTNQQIINFNTRVLGRRGVMRVTLVTSPNDFDDSVSELKDILQGFKYDQGERYSDFRQGDKVAAYGLAALIAGGAAAVATKKGFWTVIAGFFAAAWKFIAAIAAAIMARFRSLFKKKK